MSWIIKDLWKTLELHQSEYANLLTDDDRITAYEIINRIASDVGSKWGVFLQLNFPPGQSNVSSSNLGHRNLTVLVFRDRKKFANVSESEVKQAFDPLNPIAIDSAGFGYEGFRVRLSNGRIDCLPGGIHLWCEITPQVLEVLDWLFANAYGMEQTEC
ncbi:MAG: hypothetical protein AUF79_16030 [Crenarchaeota archaeon 13_1_20CM_2_51_8]|nr:MAG: hypothetical protein AUF79_16030 [Crenarchaeota archaeon 13_1_20CM_2_51_8]